MIIKHSCIRDENTMSTDATLSAFRPATAEEIILCLQRTPSKTMKFDPILSRPTWLVKAVSVSLAPDLFRVVNASLFTRILPLLEKRAIVTLVFVKSSLNADIVNNYRPISCLTFLSKLIERVVFNSISTYIEQFSLLSPFQSAFPKRFSIETAFVKFLSDVLIASESGILTCVVSLDLSAAFDVVDHHILLDRLSRHFGIRENSS